MSTPTEKYFYAIGRRKTSTATVRLFNQKGVSQINEKKAMEYLPTATLKKRIYYPILKADLHLDDYHFTAKVKGGGFNSQMEAITLGLSRAIIKIFPEKKKSLKDLGFLTRDSRMVERKKTGRRKARKSEQYSKR